MKHIHTVLLWTLLFWLYYHGHYKFRVDSCDAFINTLQCRCKHNIVDSLHKGSATGSLLFSLFKSVYIDKLNKQWSNWWVKMPLCSCVVGPILKVLNCKIAIGHKTFDRRSIVRWFYKLFGLSPFITHIHFRKFCSETESGYVAV